MKLEIQPVIVNFSSDQNPFLSCLFSPKRILASVSSGDSSGENEFHNIVEKDNDQRNIFIYVFTESPENT